MKLVYELEEDHPGNFAITKLLSDAMRRIPDLQVFVIGQVTRYGTWAPAFKDLRSSFSKFGHCETVPSVSCSWAEFDVEPYIINGTGQFHWEVGKDPK